MTAVDTKVVVRLLTADDPAQAANAKSLFAAESIWISKTVLLETAWVLTSLYGFRTAEVSAAFIKLLGLPNVQTESKRKQHPRWNSWPLASTSRTPCI